jgi:hypothetical protein
MPVLFTVTGVPSSFSLHLQIKPSINVKTTLIDKTTLHVQQEIQTAIDRNDVSALVLLDLSVAFHKVVHDTTQRPEVVIGHCRKCLHLVRVLFVRQVIKSV